MAKRKGPTPKGGRPAKPPTLRPCYYCGRKTQVGYGQAERENAALARLPHSPDVASWSPLCWLTHETAQALAS